MLIIVAYDVSTETAAGRRRLRRVAKVCESMGHAVQKSVFECQVNEMQFEQLERALLAEIEEAEDNLRFSGWREREPAGEMASLHIDGPSLPDARTWRIETWRGPLPPADAPSLGTPTAARSDSTWRTDKSV
jgi:CRISPR-associated protein Cas2